MNILTLIAIYAMIWWVTLFMILPIGNISHHEAGVKSTDGGDPGAPLITNLKQKLLVNTGLAFVIWLGFFIVTKFKMIDI
jgi:predicted secreted protein